MKVKYKTIIIAVLSVIPVIIINYFIFSYCYFGYINKQRQEEVKRNFDAINYIISKEESNIKSTLEDWAKWNDTHEFMKDGNKSYIDLNLQDETLKNLNFKSMIFVNNSGKVVYEKENNSNRIKETILKNIKLNHIKQSKIGLLANNNITYIVGISPVTPSIKTMNSDGVLIVVRQIDDNILNYIKNILRIEVSIQDIKKINAKEYKGLTQIDTSIKINDNKYILEAIKTLKDFNDKKSITVKIISNLEGYKDVMHYIIMFNIGFIILVTIIILIDLILVDKFIIRRLTRLNKFMEEVAISKDTTLSIEMSGRDEYAKLAMSTNKMLFELNSAYKETELQNQRFIMIMEATNDGFLDFYVKVSELYISPEWKQIIGCDSSDGFDLYKQYISKVHPECSEKIKEQFQSVTTGKSEYFSAEYRMVRESGDTIWVLHRGKVVEKDENDNPTRIVSTMVNITDRKKYEEEILFLSYSDKLTGLKNRAYMEKQLEVLDENEESRYSIIMGDVNGLKVTNDALGHKEGDRLLNIVSEILKKTCSSNDIISRWGGDEFIILIKNKDKSYVETLINNIKQNSENIYDFPFKVSISLGYASKHEQNLNAGSVMNLAERRMYRNKLTESKSTRSATISSLLKTLHEKHSETEEHTVRIEKLSLKLGKALGLTPDKLDELKLLSFLHDVGKIGIPEQILMKPSTLSKEEWCIMKTHTEIGYRIAKSTPELSYIADDILAHHEKYDGTGYPNKLKGEEIPLLSRIINVVDSFDVMTNKRVYKEAATMEYAIEELMRCSGTQFDPFIVEEFIHILKDN